MSYWQESRANSLKSIFAVFWWNVVVPRGKQTSPRPNLAPSLDMCSLLKVLVFVLSLVFSFSGPDYTLAQFPSALPRLFCKMWRMEDEAARKTVRDGAKIHTSLSPLKLSNTSIARYSFCLMEPPRSNSQDSRSLSDILWWSILIFF